MPFKNNVIYTLVLAVLTLFSSSSNVGSTSLAMAAPVPPMQGDAVAELDVQSTERHPGCNDVPWARGCNYPSHTPKYPPKNGKPVHGNGKGKPPSTEEQTAVEVEERVVVDAGPIFRDQK